MSKFKTSHKLIAGFLVTAFLCGMVGFFGINGFSKLGVSQSELAENRLPSVENLLMINKDIIKIRVAVRSFLIPNLIDSDRKNQVDNIEDALKEIDLSWKIYVPLSQTPEESLLWNDFVKYYTSWKKNLDEFLDMNKNYINLKNANSPAKNEIYQKMQNLAFTGMREDFKQTNDLIKKLVSLNRSLANNLSKESLATISSFKTLILSITVIAFIFAIGIGFFFAQTLITKPMKMLFQMFERVLLSSKALLQVSEQSASASTELSAQTSTSAASSEQISANISTVSSAAEEMASSVREISGNTNNASGITKEALQKASSANEVMNRLGISSNEIGSIIKTINSIAEQTNLLALNATIEAARAGESGKGFAVVANEVKELAKESAKATEDISKRIKMIQDDSSNAVIAIKDIIEIMAQVNDITNTIASAVEEQTVTVNEINRNLSEATKGANSIAEGNAAIASASEDYSKMANHIKNTSLEIQQQITTIDGELKSKFKI